MADIHVLDEVWLRDLVAKRAWVRGHDASEAQTLCDSVEGKLRLLDTILAKRWIEPHETVKLQALGVTLGDVLVERFGLCWCLVTDEYGTDPALIVAGRSIRLFPLTMISKRIERGETVEVRELVEGIGTGLARALSEAD